MLKLQVLDFINHNPDWRRILSGKPYFITIKDGYGYTLLKYTDDSDFNNIYVRECRGLIIYEDNAEWKVACLAFTKFFNYDEKYFMPEIDWESAKSYEKMDGILIKYWSLNGVWHISTNGAINARDVKLVNPNNEFSNVGELVESILKTDYKDFKFDENITYTFELTSPLNQIILLHEKSHLWLIGMRDKNSLYEYDISNIDCRWKPRMYGLKTLDDCINFAYSMKTKGEGFVVVDKNFNRVKIKNPLYIATERMIGSGISDKKILTIFLNGNMDSILIGFPDYINLFNKVEKYYLQYMKKVSQAQDVAIQANNMFTEKKDKAQYIIKRCKEIGISNTTAFWFLKYPKATEQDFINALKEREGVDKVAELILAMESN